MTTASENPKGNQNIPVEVTQSPFKLGGFLVLGEHPADPTSDIYPVAFTPRRVDGNWGKLKVVKLADGGGYLATLSSVSGHTPDEKILGQATGSSEREAVSKLYEIVFTPTPEMKLLLAMFK